MCWPDDSIGRSQVRCLMALLEDDPSGIEDAEHSAPWFRWALTGGAEPKEPRAESSWLARRVREWVEKRR